MKEYSSSFPFFVTFSNWKVNFCSHFRDVFVVLAETEKDGQNVPVFEKENTKRESAFAGHDESSPNQAILRAKEKIRETIRFYREKEGIPGISIAIRLNGKPFLSEGVGYADIENGVKMKPETPLRIASISKAFTSAALGILLEKDLIELNAPVQKYVPSFPTKPEGNVTIRHLACHLSGIRHYKEGEFHSMKEFRTILDALKVFQDDPLASSPGSRFLYTTHGFTLLSAAIEGASGMDYIKFMKEKIFEPIGMHSTGPEDHLNIIMHRPRYYVRNSNKLENVPFVDLSMKWAGGGFVSTVGDLVKFGEAMMGTGSISPLLHSQTRSMLFEHQKTNEGKSISYGLGWELFTKDRSRLVNSLSSRMIFHTGGAVGASSVLLLLPADRLVVAAIANLEGVGKPLVSMSTDIANIIIDSKQRA